LEKSLEIGRPLPAWHLEAPEELPPDAEFIAAFGDLSSERRYEGGPIPASAIRAYALNILYAEDAEFLGDFTAVIRGMDAVYLEWADDERKRRSKAHQASTKNKGSTSGSQRR
jgi:hypothetical protein